MRVRLHSIDDHGPVLQITADTQDDQVILDTLIRRDNRKIGGKGSTYVNGAATTIEIGLWPDSN